MVNRIVTELRRANLVTEAKNAINDAIVEASATRFFFNEVRGLTFNSAAGTEYYPDLGMTDIDVLYYLQGGTRFNLFLDNDRLADARADGNQISGQTQSYSRNGTDIRLYPIPSDVLPFYMNGSTKLTPYPLVADTDTNAWMTYGERYIRALAKSIMLKDVIRDYSEAAILDAVAEDQRQILLDMTTQRQSTDTIVATQW
jgi:hypothetical protein